MKKDIIYNQVLHMLNNNCDYQSITLSNIARKCDMGKSTIYEYFESKDEMIFSSLIYYMKTAIKLFNIEWDEKEFREALSDYVKVLIASMKANYWIVMPWTFDSFKRYLPEKNQLYVDKLLGNGQNLAITVLDSIAKREEAHFTKYSEDNVKFTFFGVVGLLSNSINDTFDLASDECELLVNRCINFICEVMR